MAVLRNLQCVGVLILLVETLTAAPAPLGPRQNLVGKWVDSREVYDLPAWQHELKPDGTFFSVGSVAKEMRGKWELRGNSLLLHRQGYHWNFAKYYGPGLYGKKAPNAPLTFEFRITDLLDPVLRGSTTDPEGQGKPKMKFILKRSAEQITLATAITACALMAPAPLPRMPAIVGTWQVTAPLWKCTVTFSADGIVHYGQPWDRFRSTWRYSGGRVEVKDRLGNDYWLRWSFVPPRTPKKSFEDSGTNYGRMQFIKER